MQLMKNKILVPVDGSKNSEKSLRYACWLASKIGAPITILHVVTTPYTIPPIHPEDEPLNMELLMKKLEAQGKTILEESKKIAIEEGCEEPKDEMRHRTGNAGHEIVKLSKEGDYSLIIMGARGHTLLTHLLLGSVSDVVVHHAPCPVLIVR
jgi:nucleotide-binding universal stress UspA family protein